MIRYLFFITFFCVIVTFYALSNQGGLLGLQPEENEELSAGSATVFMQSGIAFGQPAPSLTREQKNAFGVGNTFFNQSWVAAGNTAKGFDGLGPLFNAQSCSSCHRRDGRARLPVDDTYPKPGFLMRMSIGNTPEGGPIPDPSYGGQLQDRAIHGIDAEGDIEISFEYFAGEYPDGTTYELRKPVYRYASLTQGKIQARHFSPRIANHLVGMGLLEAIPDQTLIDLSDPDDLDGDGISGRINYVPHVEMENQLVPGRFGWKATQPTVRQQVASAFSGDMGLTSELFPNENCPHSIDCDQLPNGGNPEVTTSQLNRVTSYVSGLAVPVRRDWSDQSVLRGKAIFRELNCNACHVEKLTTGAHAEIEQLSHQVIRPYTDLLLHDMGPDLADNSPDFLATGQEWRTPPLWGIGLFEKVNGHTNYLHDGRATNLEEAILWHGGEAEQIRDSFKELTAEDREALINFLNSL
ncbi:MAG: di-heme oxidoredictase family protein [Bacteroidota bacterium]